MKNFSIVVPGFWNTSIMNPDWLVAELKQYIPDEVLNKPQVGLNFSGIPEFSVSFGALEISPNSKMLMVKLNQEVRDESKSLSIEGACGVAIHLLTSLDKTPMQGCGLNFHYALEESTIDDALQVPFDIGLEPISKNFTCSYTVDSEVSLNIARVGKELQFNFSCSSITVPNFIKHIGKFREFEEICKDIIEKLP